MGSAAPVRSSGTGGPPNASPRFSPGMQAPLRRRPSIGGWRTVRKRSCAVTSRERHSVVAEGVAIRCSASRWRHSGRNRVREADREISEEERGKSLNSNCRPVRMHACRRADRLGNRDRAPFSGMARCDHSIRRSCGRNAGVQSRLSRKFESGARSSPARVCSQSGRVCRRFGRPVGRNPRYRGVRSDGP